MPIYEGIGLINEKHPVVLEIGKSFTRAGFAGDSSPRCVIPSVVGTNKLYDFKDEDELYQMLVEFLHHIYSRYLLVTPKDRKVVIVESIFSTTKWRHILAKVLYLHYEVLTVLWVPSSIAAVVTTNQDTAFIIDFGTEEVQVIPVFRGVTVLKAVICQELGATVFDENLKQILLENCSDIPKEDIEPLLTPDKIEDIRVRCCVVTSTSRSKSFDDPASSSKFKPFTYELDGQNVVRFDGRVREKPGEIWFQNNDLDGVSLPLMILQVLSLCPVDTRKPLAESLLITGGTGMLPGLKGRLLKELSSLVSSASDLFDPVLKEKFAAGGYKFKVFQPLVRENIVNWLGGALYGATEIMNLRGVPKEFFLKHGCVPDWCHLQYDMVNGIRTTTEGPPGGGSRSSSGSARESPAPGAGGAAIR